MLKHIHAFFSKPIRYIIYIHRIITNRGVRFYIYMKSGNVIAVDMNNIRWERQDGRLVKVEWENCFFPNRELNTIDIDQIEAIVTKR